MWGVCFLVGLCTITTTVNCFRTPHHRASYRSRLSNSLHVKAFLRQLGGTNLATTTRDGYTFDDCEFDFQCNFDRQCFSEDSTRSDPESCSGGSDCWCLPSDHTLVGCTEPNKCDSGETCASRGNQTFPYCLSEDFARRNRLTIVTSPPGDGFTRDSCSDDSNCQDGRDCVYALKVSEICDNRDPCFCLPQTRKECCVDTDCVRKEICAGNVNAEDQSPQCVSPLAPERESNWKASNCTRPNPPTPRPSPSNSPPNSPSNSPPNSPSNSPSNSPPSAPTPSSESSPGPPPPPTPTQSSPPFVNEGPLAPCIAVHLLGHLSESELVFRKHVWSKVLCDAQTSCATSGHIVIYKGKSLMMSSYCQIVGCNTRVMQVNSPRYRRKHRVASMTEGLEFTVFSARYETSLEQYVMTVAVKIGL